MAGVYVFGDVRDWFDFGIGGSMDRFDDEAKKLIAEIMRDCSSRADDKIAALCRRVADERAVEIAALRKKLEASDAQAINNMSLYRGELAARKNGEMEMGLAAEKAKREAAERAVDANMDECNRLAGLLNLSEKALKITTNELDVLRQINLRYEELRQAIRDIKI